VAYVSIRLAVCGKPFLTRKCIISTALGKQRTTHTHTHTHSACILTCTYTHTGSGARKHRAVQGECRQPQDSSAVFPAGKEAALLNNKGVYGLLFGMLLRIQ
jgi:hypothetical protein